MVLCRVVQVMEAASLHANKNEVMRIVEKVFRVIDTDESGKVPVCVAHSS